MLKTEDALIVCSLTEIYSHTSNYGKTQFSVEMGSVHRDHVSYISLVTVLIWKVLCISAATI
jgi:hypothetical protein